MQVSRYVRQWLHWRQVETKASIHLKIWGVQLPLVYPFLLSPFIPLLASFSLPLPSLISLPRVPHHLNQLGERCKLPRWGLGQSASRQTI